MWFGWLLCFLFICYSRPISGKCPAWCGMFQKCINNKCVCNKGYEEKLPGTHMRHCQDIDECMGSNPCDQSCHNTQGSFYCSCRSGYTISGNGKTCTKIPNYECNQLGCDHKCVRQYEDVYACECNEGYYLVGRTRCERESSSKDGGNSTIKVIGGIVGAVVLILFSICVVCLKRVRRGNGRTRVPTTEERELQRVVFRPDPLQNPELSTNAPPGYVSAVDTEKSTIVEPIPAKQDPDGDVLPTAPPYPSAIPPYPSAMEPNTMVASHVAPPSYNDAVYMS